MRLPIKSLASLLLVTAVAAAVPGMSSKLPGGKKQESRFDRLLQKHDRKGELRASVLGLEPAVFRAMHKRMPLEAIARRQGFSSVRNFRLALFGKLKNELRSRGWSNSQIERYVAVRSSRLS